MKLYSRILGVAFFASALALASGCGDDGGTTAKDTSTTDTADTAGGDTTVTDTVETDSTETDTTTTDTGGGDTGGTTEYATLTFAIDDTANMTYDATDGLAWKGSFSYDSDTNVLTFDGSWGGPFVPLYDDGPAPGGHEPDGATAGDHIWSVAVKVASPEADQAFEYGAIRGSTDGSDGSWIWTGSNGTVTVPAGSTDTIAATGLTIAPFGTVDLKLTIDVSNSGANLDALFQGADYTDVKVKGSAWGWNEIAMVDDGTNGDETSGDGIYTFILSKNLAKHDGLMKTGDKAEFVFVLDSSEYKDANGAADEGVAAQTRGGTEGAWDDATIAFADNTNTYVQAGFYPPADTVAVNFSIDDTANQTYDDTDGLAWKGSFSYDPDTRMLTFDGSWGGPFAVLYDDGPWNMGGHEPAGSTAGDHIWGITVWTSNAADQTFEYGAIRGSVDGADGSWIWTGSNGTFMVTANGTTAIDATGLVIAPFGTTDLKLTLDTSGTGANLDPLFQGVTYTKVQVKGSAWGWNLIDMVDDGTKGDDTASDGIYTFVLSENLAKHDGLLTSGQVAQFVFVLDDSEYKDGSGAATEGVGAYLKPDGGSYTAATVSLYGTDNNTSVTAE